MKVIPKCFFGLISFNKIGQNFIKMLESRDKDKHVVTLGAFSHSLSINSMIK